MHEIPDSWGTACNVQAMVFGNLGATSGTGVAFTRNPSTGENVLYGEWLPNAQGEDVVAGIRTPLPIAKTERSNGTSLEESQPAVFEEFIAVARRLEAHFRDLQDIEFTIQDGRLFMLQCRSGKRTAKAAVRIAVELVRDGILTKHEALQRVEAKSLDQLLHPTLDPDAPKTSSRGVFPQALELRAARSCSTRTRPNARQWPDFQCFSCAPKRRPKTFTA